MKAREICREPVTIRLDGREVVIQVDRVRVDAPPTLTVDLTVLDRATEPFRSLRPSDLMRPIIFEPRERVDALNLGRPPPPPPSPNARRVGGPIEPGRAYLVGELSPAWPRR